MSVLNFKKQSEQNKIKYLKPENYYIGYFVHFKGRGNILDQMVW